MLGAHPATHLAFLLRRFTMSTSLTWQLPYRLSIDKLQFLATLELEVAVASPSLLAASFLGVSVFTVMPATRGLWVIGPSVLRLQCSSWLNCIRPCHGQTGRHRARVAAPLPGARPIPAAGRHGKAQSRTRSGTVTRTAEAPGRTGGRSIGLKRAAAARSARTGRASTRAKLVAAVATVAFAVWRSLAFGPAGLGSRCEPVHAAPRFGGSGQLRCHVAYWKCTIAAGDCSKGDLLKARVGWPYFPLRSLSFSPSSRSRSGQRPQLRRSQGAELYI
jgi:hypothetical protein